MGTEMSRVLVLASLLGLAALGCTLPSGPVFDRPLIHPAPPPSVHVVIPADAA